MSSFDSPQCSSETDSATSPCLELPPVLSSPAASRLHAPLCPGFHSDPPAGGTPPTDAGAEAVPPEDLQPDAEGQKVLSRQLAPWHSAYQSEVPHDDAASTASQPMMSEIILAAAFAHGFSAGTTMAAVKHAANLSRSKTCGAASYAMDSRSVVRACSIVGKAGGSNEMQKQKCPPCKWHARGTCKFGRTCRFKHAGCNHHIPTNTSEKDYGDSEEAQMSAADKGGSSSEVETMMEAVAKERLIFPQRSEVVDSDQHVATGTSDGSNCQVIWCDQRAFKEASDDLKSQLEERIHLPVKIHKTAEKCMRSLQKRRNNEQEHGVPRRTSVYLVSWASAQTLVPFVSEISRDAAHTTKIIVLCDLCGSKKFEAVKRWSRLFPLVQTVAATWEEAALAVRKAVNSVQEI